MAKKNKKKDTEAPAGVSTAVLSDDKPLTPEQENEVKNTINEATSLKVKTSKETLKKIEKQVRRLDNVVSDLCVIKSNMHEIVEEMTYDDYDLKDYDRAREINDVVHSAIIILFHLDKRMARKYVGKKLEDVIDVYNDDRKALKK